MRNQNYPNVEGDRRLSAAATEPAAKWLCKCDDDTLVHVNRLEATLRHVESKHPDRAIYFGHLKWRGWDAGDHGPNTYKSGFRFQACGGTWGDARKTQRDILSGGLLHGTTRYPPCPHAAGPYPYMSGGMVCMSRRLALQMAQDEHFRNFNAVAHARNTAGTPCRKPLHCAAQPSARRRPRPSSTTAKSWPRPRPRPPMTSGVRRDTGRPPWR